ncbi:MAG: bifunctional 4-hydroxy-2-oxoglutarate aldolase/2-dehydro-3-deoxy-phosphogluconate aldolase [Candidatus Omnitrophica bacterium]|nr:bifunctional 4-hydroxy-2-oxoglutarate aldolase/2-dehydro-3-deoxy-phosphogluconate aldolase [Candidatus Omnitrophota bacterium]
MDITRFRKLPVIGILRGIEKNALGPLVEAIMSSGLETLEITMNTKGAASLIKEAAKLSRGRLTIGAGTVLDMASLRTALDSGAEFIVMPVVVEEVVAHCVKHKIAVFPGALTAQEVYRAWKTGATMVKVFPAGVFGPAYFRELKAPLDEVELLACGGVTAENMKDYFANGASAVAFGASVFKKEWLAKGDYASIAAGIRKFTVNCQP